MLTRGVPHDRKQCLLPAPRPAPHPLRIHMRVATEKAWLHLPDLTHRVDPTQRNSKPIANIPSRPHQRLPSNRSIRPAPPLDHCYTTHSRPRSSSDRVLTFFGQVAEADRSTEADFIVPDPWPFSDSAIMRQRKSATNAAVSPEQPCLQQLIPANAAKELLYPVI